MEEKSDEKRKPGFGKYMPALFCLLTFILTLILFSGEIAFFFRTEKPLVETFTFFDGQSLSDLEDEGHKVTGDWITKDDALSLPPSGKGTVVFNLWRRVKSKPVFEIEIIDTNVDKFGEDYVLKAGISRRQKDLQGFHTRDKTYKVVGKLGTGSHILYLEGFIQSDGPSVPIIKRITRKLYFEEALQLFYFPALLVIIFAPIALLIIFEYHKKGIVVGIICFILLASTSKIYPDATRFYPFLLYLITFLYFIRKIREKSEWQKIIPLILFSIIVFGFALRWPLLVEKAGHILDPDAQGYLDIARNGGGLFNTATDTAPYIREPLFIWFIRAAFLFGPDNDTTLRFLTLCLSVLIIPATYWFGKDRFGKVPSLIASFFCAWSPFFVFMSVRGLRMELYILCTLLFLWSLDLFRKNNVWSGIRIGASAGAITLARFTSLSFTIPLTIFFAFLRKANWRYVLIALVIPFLFITPHIIFNYMQTGDPMFTSNIHAKFYRNREFAGEPGFPTETEVAEDPYTGEEISTFRYIFRLHSIPEIFKITFRGFFRIFVSSHAYVVMFNRNFILFLFYAAGVFIILFTGKRIWLLIVFILEAPSAFLAGMQLDPRLTMHIGPLLYLITAFGIYFLIKHVIKLVASRKRKGR